MSDVLESESRRVPAHQDSLAAVPGARGKSALTEGDRSAALRDRFI